ncbi:MAG: aminotransferase class I/II-fold pyridoxal phosphate-dependent enzyme [Candidatus Bathycorpusculaceae bacterium]
MESHDCYLLFDGTYCDFTYGRKLPHAASLSSKAMSVSTLSKTYGAPGIRIGHIAVRNSALIESFLPLKSTLTFVIQLSMRKSLLRC